MRKINKIFFVIGLLVSLCLITSCDKLNKYETIDEKYTIRFVDKDGNIVKSVTNLVGVAFDVNQVPEVPYRAGYTVSWLLNDSADIDYSQIQKNTIIKAGYEIDKFTVVFIDHSGVQLSSQRVEWDADAVAPADPTRTGYTFKGWDKPYTKVNDDLTIKAVYEINKYNVKFKDFDGTVLQDSSFDYMTAAIAPVDPTRTGYTFKGWDKDFSSITGDLEVTALYDINVYEVKFNDHDGTGLKKENVEYKASATAPTEPTRTGYTFKAWDKDFSEITENLVVTALYDINVYEVKFLDHDGTELKKENVEYKASATAPTEPTRTGYTFKAWDKAFNEITEDLVVTALYDINVYEVKFLDHDGTELKKENVEYKAAATAPADPTKLGHAFTGWDKDFSEITADLVVTAVYKPIKYTVSVELPLVTSSGETAVLQQVFGEFDYDSVQDFTVKLNNIASTTPGFTFSGWNQKTGTDTYVALTPAELASFRIPNGNVVLTPNFTIISYTVVFKDYDGKMLSTQEVEYKHPATAPSVSERTGYEFVGWDKEFTEVTETMVVNAVYEIKQFTVKFYDQNNDLVSTQSIKYKEAAVAPVYDVVGYRFSWDVDFSEVTSDLDVHASIVLKTYTIKIYVGDNEVTYVELKGQPLHYQDVFIPDFVIVGKLQFTGKLFVVFEECVGKVPSAEFYDGAYVVEDVDVIVFRAELIPTE